MLSTYQASFSKARLSYQLKQTSPGSAREPLAYGKVFPWRKDPLPLAPDDGAFAHAARWSLALPETSSPGLSDVFLSIHYDGDVARLADRTRLIDDDFWNGVPWALSLKNLHYEGVQKNTELQILDWSENAHIYLEADSAHERNAKPSIRLTPQYEVRLRFRLE